MKKIGIVSINIHSKFLNYGAALHSFAFQKYLKKQGFDSVILDYKSKHFGNLKLDNLPFYYIKEKYPIKTILNSFLNYFSYKRKYKAFHNFYSENCVMLDNSGVPYTYDDFESNQDDINLDFDVVVCESDVIWSPKTSCGFDYVFFCAYSCFKNKLKIAYAPSISNTVLSDVQETEFKKLLSNFDYLSSREWQTAEYIQTLTGRKCEHVLDPVLLLNAEDYEPLMEIQDYKNYLLVYNVMKNDFKMIKYAKKVAKLKNLKLIEISDFVRNRIYHKTLTGRSIGEFLYLIKNSSYFITNGFHGVCFAIIFKRNFLCFERDGIDLKNKSLLGTLGLGDYFVKHSSWVCEKPDINWDNVYNNLEFQRVKSYNYIKSNIMDKCTVNITGGG